MSPVYNYASSEMMSFSWVSPDLLFLQRNALSGSIPGPLSNWTSARRAYFHENDFTGSLESLCGYGLDDLFSDCEEVDCPCCTYCCSGTECQWTGIGRETGEAPVAPLKTKLDRAPGNL